MKRSPSLMPGIPFLCNGRLQAGLWVWALEVHIRLGKVRATGLGGTERRVAVGYLNTMNLI